MLTGAGPHDRRAGDNGDFTFGLASASQFLSQFANDGRFRFVRIDDRVDELKNIRARCRALHRHHAHTLVANDDFVAFTNVEELNGARDAFFSVHCDCGVHHRRPHLDLLAVNADEGLLIRHHVELGRENAVGRRRGQLGVCAFRGFGAVLSQSQDQFIQRVACLRRDLDARESFRLRAFVRS